MGTRNSVNCFVNSAVFKLLSEIKVITPPNRRDNRSKERDGPIRILSKYLYLLKAREKSRAQDAHGPRVGSKQARDF